MFIRTARPADYDYMVSVVTEWWDGPENPPLLPRHLLESFSDTSFVMDNDDLIAGFVVGYQAPADPRTGYVHFIGVDRDYRRQGIARKLYAAFATELHRRGASVIKGITAEHNTLSQSIHRNMGFDFEDGDVTSNGVPIQLDYDGKGQHRVVFIKSVRDFSERS